MTESRDQNRGLREWDGHSHYNRYEATPYEALEILFQSYNIERHSRVVDFGCGRGRVAFYIHKRFRIPVVGIEAHETTYLEALQNKSSYRLKAKHIAAPILFEYGLAEHYEVQPEDTCFYFFNPFSDRVFAKVLRNIMTSVKKAPRIIDLILFYPLPKYKKWLRNTPLGSSTRSVSPEPKTPSISLYLSSQEEALQDSADDAAVGSM